MNGPEMIIVRSLAESDMRLFSAHRQALKGKRRAIAVTARAAQQLLHPEIFARKRGEYDCICPFGGVVNREQRLINKGDKNWRLGGRQLSDAAFAGLEIKDFALIRSVRENDGSSPILLTFIGRRSNRLLQAGLSATLAEGLQQSVAIFGSDAPEFGPLGDLFPPVPARVAVQRPQLAQLQLALP